MTAHQTESTNNGQDELVITRVFNAPRELVFKSFTELERLKHWWGPSGLKWVRGTVDLNPAGLFHYCFATPDGGEMWGKFTYREIVSPEKLVYTSAFSNASGETVRAPFSATFPLEVLNTVTLKDLGGKTELTLRGTPHNATSDEQSFFTSMFLSMNQGFAGTLDQLESYLTSL